MLLYRTVSPYSLPQSKNAGGPPPTAKTQTVILVDEKGRIVTRLAPDVPPNDLAVQSSFDNLLTDAAVKRHTPLPNIPCYAVTIRNLSGRRIRVTRDPITDDAEWDAAKFNTITPSFSKRIPCKNANEFSVGNADGLADAETFELTFEVFTP